MAERRNQCLDLGLQFGRIMQAATLEDVDAAEAIGLKISRGDNNDFIVNISSLAAKTYIDQNGGNSLEWILDEIAKAECMPDLKMDVTKFKDGGYVVIQHRDLS